VTAARRVYRTAVERTKVFVPPRALSLWAAERTRVQDKEAATTGRRELTSEAGAGGNLALCLRATGCALAIQLPHHFYAS
jgi:hypothetical protein